MFRETLSRNRSSTCRVRRASEPDVIGLQPHRESDASFVQPRFHGPSDKTCVSAYTTSRNQFNFVDGAA